MVVQSIKSSVVQDTLRMGTTLAELANRYSITVKRHPKYPNLVQLKYSQIDSDFNLPIVRQCRGIILDESSNWSIVARPFDKFGNPGESYVPTIDWGSVTIQEKLDGSLLFMYYYDKKWNVATTGSPDAGGEVHGYGMSFSDLFWDAYQAKGYMMPGWRHEGSTFMFELTSPFNRIVVKQNGIDLRLIGVRENLTGHEWPVGMFPMFDAVKSFTAVNDLSALLKTFENIDPTSSEGYVVVDKDFNRLKVKHPGYVALHHMKDGLLSRKRILEVIRAGEMPETIAVFPELEKAFVEIKALYEGLAMAIQQDWNYLANLIPDEISVDTKVGRKLFAIEAMKTIVPGALFAMLDGRVTSPKEFLRTMHIDKLADILKLDEVELIGA
jgi:T4 RnlA family RNA ligase